MKIVQTVELELTEEQYNKMIAEAGKRGLTISEYLAKVLDADPFLGTYENNTLLADLLVNNDTSEVTDFLDLIEDKKNLEEELEQNKKEYARIERDEYYCSSEADRQEELADLTKEYNEIVRDIERVNDHINEMMKYYLKANPDFILEDEIETCKKWLRDVK